MKWILTIGATGLSLQDLEPRVYTPAGALQVGTANLTLTEDAVAGNYVLELVAPRPAVGRWWVTLAWPQGFGSAWSWPETNPADRAVVPLRQTSVTITGRHWLNYAPSGEILTIAEVEGSAGDYRVTGWSSTQGAHQLTFEIGGQSYPGFTWQDWATASGGSIGLAEHEAEIEYLITNWRRTALATIAGAPAISDPGHGQDEISPVALVGTPFDPDSASDTAPFTAEDLRDHDVAGVTIDGCGFLAVELRPLRPPRVLTPGITPEVEEEHVIDVLIITPSKRGPRLSMIYASALASMFRYLVLEPGSGIDEVRNLQPPPERPSHESDDGTWRYDRLLIPMTRYYRALQASA